MTKAAANPTRRVLTELQMAIAGRHPALGDHGVRRGLRA